MVECENNSKKDYSLCAGLRLWSNLNKNPTREDRIIGPRRALAGAHSRDIESLWRHVAQRAESRFSL